jgi:aminoglycoside phosphotransferase family enzyme/predicted kinase
LLGFWAVITEDQQEIVVFLASPSTHGGASVERVDTHASIVFLSGSRAWKLKRAVRYDYLDFSTLERRRAMCEAELQVNRRAAPGLYRGVAAVVRRPDGSLSLGGSGTPVEWLVEMVRFDQDALFDRLAARGALEVSLMRPLAAAIASFHDSAERRTDHGGTPGMAWVVDGNALGFAEQGRRILDPGACALLTNRTRVALQRHSRMLDARREAGFVRHCHGDLHLRNIVLFKGRPTLFDGIEFNDEIACIDVLYDLAFLVMDLWRRRLPWHANAVWNDYLSETSDVAGIPLLPLFLSCRAAVRAKTSATSANLEDDALRNLELQRTARDYLALAQQLLEPPPPCLVAVGGFSGSGKSTLARRLAPDIGPVPGAMVIRSDELRKRICGVDPLRRLGPEGYSEDVTRQVYSAAADRGGHAAIVDAVYARPADRAAIERVATAAGVPFVGVWLDVAESELMARAERRQLDASDADAGVIRQQIARQTGLVTWHRLDAAPGPEQVARQATDVLCRRLTTGIVRVGESRKVNRAASP